MRDVSELIDGPDGLRIAAAYGQDMPYIGWIEATFRLAVGGAAAEKVFVPMLVMKGRHLSQPIISYNVIERIVTTAANHPDETNRDQLHMLLTATFPILVPAFIDLVSAETSGDNVIKTTKERVNIPKHTSVQVECRVKTRPLK